VSLEIPEELRYSPDHLWVREEDDGEVVVGITDYAQEQLGKVVYVDLPEEDEVVAAGEELGAIESAKSVSDLISPVNGEVRRVNQAAVDDPGLINDDPYGDGWLVKVALEGEPAELMDAAAYRESLEA
jgi:glycine cleavage system H protein